MADLPAFIWLLLVPLIATPFVYLVGRIFDVRGNLIARWAALVVLGVTWLPFILAVLDLDQNGADSYTLGTVTLRFDELSLLLAALSLGLSTVVVLYSAAYMQYEGRQEKYYACLTALTGVMIGLGCAGDLFNLWAWFEGMAIASFLLVAFYHEQANALEAGIKYLVQSAVGSALVMLGIALVLANTGTLDLVEIRAAAGDSTLLLAAGALFVIGFGIKAALVPMHTWLPDAHSQAPSGISAMLSGVVIEAGLIAMLRSVAALAGVSDAWGEMLMVFGVLNMVVGNLLALRQTQVKRLLAFSSLSHVGYMLVGLGVAIYANDATGAQGSLFHMLNHGLMKGLAFLAAGSLLYTLHVAAGSHAPLTIADLNGAAKRYPLTALGLSIAVLGLGGLPPLAGFMSKWQIFVAGFNTHESWIQALIVFAALNSVLSLGYYAPLVNALYREEESEAVVKGKRLPLTMSIPVVVLSVAVIVIGIWPALLRWLAEPAGDALLATFGF
ncbi:MAG: hypothetical protein JXA10_12710 [Anaerolineae bacterium]|nr:hypothetical protein [Anaerolineae bacterium]